MRPVGLSPPASWIPAPVRGREDQNKALWLPKLQFTRFPLPPAGSPFTGHGLCGSEDIPPGNSYSHGETIFIP